MPIEGGDIVWRVLINADKFEEGMTQVSKSADAIKSKFESTLTAASALGKGMTVVGGSIVAALSGAVYATVQLGSQLTDMAARTGVSVEALSGLKFAAEQSGTSIETLEGAIKKMQVGLSGVEIDPKTGEAAGAFADAIGSIGLSIDALKSKSPEAQFRAIAEAIGNIQDPTQRAATAVEIFGKSGTELLPLMGEDIDALMAKAAELGLVMDTEAAAKAEKFGDTLDQLKGAMQGLLIAVGPIIIEAIVPFVQNMIEAVAAMTAWTQAHPGLTQAIVTIGGVIGGLMVVLGPLLILLPGIISAFTLMGPVIGAIGAAFVALTGPIGIAVALLVGAAVLIYKNWDGIKAGAAVIWEGIVAAWDWGVNALGAIWQAMKEMATDAWETITSIFQWGSDLVSSIFEIWVDWQMAKVNAVVSVYEWFRDGLASIWDFITTAIQVSGQIILQTIDSIINAVRSAIDWVAQMPANAASLLGFADGGVVPAFASGGLVPAFAGGGMVRPITVGERGPELAFMPVGTRILSHHDSMQAATSAMGSGTTLNFGGIQIGNIGIDAGTPSRASAERVWKEIAPHAIDDLTRRFDAAKRARG